MSALFCGIFTPSRCILGVIFKGLRVTSLGTAAFDNSAQERLLRALAEQLKLPLLQIAREAELAATNQTPESLKSISYTADMALRLVDSYLLSVQLQALPSLELEPVSVSAVLQDTAHRLNQLAKQYDAELEVHLSGKYEPVMSHRQSLEAAFATLGYSFIEAVPHAGKKHKIILGAHRSSKGLVAGVFGNQDGLSTDMYKRGMALFGTARQAVPGLTPHAGAGVFVAESLLNNMQTPLHLSRHNKLLGLAATLLPSQQLSLV
jgi:hypothetical protein